MIAKGTFVFEGRARGWTESWWLNSQNTNLQAVFDQFLPLGSLRSKLLGEECRIKAIRVSDEAELNDSFLSYVSLPGVVGVGCDDPDSTLFTVFRSLDNKQTKPVHLRGIPDDVSLNFGQYQNSLQPFRNDLTSWASYVINKGFGFSGISKTLVKRANITGYTPTVEGNVSFVLDAAIFAAPDVGTLKSIRLSGINGKSNLNGAMIVRVLSTTTFITTTPTAALPYRAGGRATYSPKTFIPVFTWSPQKIGERRVGAPLLESRGRSRNRPRG